MNLLILRHGEAQSTAASDPVRPLTVRGRAQVQAQAVAHRHLFAGVEQVFVSPYLRAQQTFQVLREPLDLPGASTANWLMPEADVAQVCEQLLACNHQSVLLVSHQPLVGTLVGYLSGGRALAMGTASLAHLTMEVPARDLALLQAIYDPDC